MSDPWIPDDLAWRDRAACKGANPELFFPDSDDQDPYALSICARCPVLIECAEDAIAMGDRQGIRAGVRMVTKDGTARSAQRLMEAVERRRLGLPAPTPREIRRPIDGVRHGTASGYNQHHCRCDECRGWNAAMRRAARARQAS